MFVIVCLVFEVFIKYVDCCGFFLYFKVFLFFLKKCIIVLLYFVVCLKILIINDCLYDLFNELFFNCVNIFW